MISSYKFSVQEEKKKTLAIYISIYSTVVQKLIYESLSLQNYNTRALKELTDLRAGYIYGTSPEVIRFATLSRCKGASTSYANKWKFWTIKENQNCTPGAGQPDLLQLLATIHI